MRPDIKLLKRILRTLPRGSEEYDELESYIFELEREDDALQDRITRKKEMQWDPANIADLMGYYDGPEMWWDDE